MRGFFFLASNAEQATCLLEHSLLQWYHEFFEKRDKMKIAKIIAFIGAVAMTIALLNGFINGDFSSDGGEILQNPWGIVSLVDLYVGFVLFSLWIVFRETHVWQAIIWVVLMMVLGFFTGAIYLLYVLLTSESDWLIVFFGKKRAASYIKK
jgi:hypothetical protein